MRILIASWGNFNMWQEVEYKFETDGKEISNVSKTSLITLQRALQPDKTIIFVLDTLYDSFAGSSNNDKVERDINYDYILSFVKKQTLEFLKSSGIDCENSKVFVLPGLWNGSRMSFKGVMTDLYYITLNILSEELSNLCTDSLEIHLDITHGINFAPLLIHNAIREIGAVFSISKDVKIIVYNSEPYIRNASSLEIHKISEETLYPSFSYFALSNPNENIFSLFSGLQDKDKSKIGKNVNEYVKSILKSVDIRELDAFAASVINLFPLGIFTFFPEYSTIKNCLCKINDLYKGNIRVDNKTVQRNIGFGKKYESLIKLKVIVKLLQNMGAERCYAVGIDKLHRLIEYLRKLGDARYIIASDEVSKIELKLEEHRFKSWILLSQLFSAQKPSKAHDKRDSSRNKRIFVAHAALEETSVEVHPDGFIRYVEEKLDVVKETIRKFVK